MEYIFDHLDKINVCVVVVTFLVLLTVYKIKKFEFSLYEVILKTLTAPTIPTGLALIICALDNSYLIKLKNISVYVALIGIIIIYISVYSILRKPGYYFYKIIMRETKKSEVLE